MYCPIGKNAGSLNGLKEQELESFSLGEPNCTSLFHSCLHMSDTRERAQEERSCDAWIGDDVLFITAWTSSFFKNLF